MKPLKYLGFLSAIVIILFLFGITIVSSNFECVGKISFNKQKKTEKIYIVVSKTRWWAAPWSESDGYMQLEIPNKIVDYYFHIVKVGNLFQIYKSKFDAPKTKHHLPNKNIKGNFSMLSKTLALETSYGFFDGKCRAIK